MTRISLAPLPEFDPLRYGVAANAVVDEDGNYVSGDDDTAAWLDLIAALPASGAFIPLHGISVISNPNALTYALGFNTDRLTMIGEGPYSGFYLDDNANCNVLRFNTSSIIVDPPTKTRLHLERFAIYGNGYNQTDSGGTNAAAFVWATRNVRVKDVLFHNCHTSALYIYDFRDARVSQCQVDTIVGQGAANGINFSGASWTGWQPQRASVVDCDFIDVVNESVFLAGNNVAMVKATGNTDSYRNLRPRLASVATWVSQWKNATQVAAAYSASTNYTIGQWVSSGGFNYLAVQANGPGSTVVTPGTDQLYWWLQNRPVSWSSGTAYVPGQCAIYPTPTNPSAEATWSSGTNYAVNQAVLRNGVRYVAVAASGPGNGGAVTPGTNSAVWQASVAVPGGFRLHFTALSSNTNVAPTTPNGTLNPKWQLGGPLFAVGANGFTLEATSGSPTSDILITGNQGNGRNMAGESVGANGCYLNWSDAAGVSMRSVGIAHNTFRGYDTGMWVFGTDGTGIDDNLIEDCASGILYGDNAVYNGRQVSVSRNKIRLGGLGQGTGLQVQKAGTNTDLIGVGVDDNEIDGGGTICQLTSALTIAGGPYTALLVMPLQFSLVPGQQLYIGPILGPGIGQVVTVSSAGAPPGATSIPVESFTPGGTLTTQTLVFPLVSSLTTQVTSSVAITSIVVNPLPFPLQSGQWISLFDANSTNFPTPVQVAPSATGVPIGATTIPINSVTPSKTYAVGSPVAVIGHIGLNAQGGLQRFHINRNNIRYVSNNLLNLLVSGGTPQAGEMIDNWMDMSGNAAFNIGNVGTSIPVRFEGGGYTNNIGGNTLPTSGVQVRNVYSLTPAKDVAAPAVPSTGVSAVMPIYDGFLAVTGAAGGATTIALGTTIQGSTLDTATINVPASTTVLIPVKAGQKVNPTYGGGNAPTWTFFAQ